jgi:hypothetical protein
VAFGWFPGAVFAEDCLQSNVRITNIGMKAFVHPKLAGVIALAEIINAIGRELEKEMHRRREARRPRIKRGATLRPSDDTPLWNALISLVGTRLRRRGARALLARELGVHRARIGEYFKRQSAMPDAERTLRLLVWLSRQPPDAMQAQF